MFLDFGLVWFWFKKATLSWLVVHAVFSERKAVWESLRARALGVLWDPVICPVSSSSALAPRATGYFLLSKSLGAPLPLPEAHLLSGVTQCLSLHGEVADKRVARGESSGAKVREVRQRRKLPIQRHFCLDVESREKISRQRVQHVKKCCTRKNF